MHSFHAPDLGPDRLALSEEEAAHASRVLRLKEGDRVLLLDGAGARAEATVEAIGRRSVLVAIDVRTTVPREREARIHLAVAPTKSIDRFEWLLEKATEIGVDRITPLITQRGERERLRTDRLKKIIVSAMKQSRRAWLPQLDEATPLDALIQGTAAAQRFFGWCEGDRSPLQRAYIPAQDAVILIGPEGDFTPEEARILREHAFTAVSLGEARLRTETAALAAITFMAFAQQAR